MADAVPRGNWTPQVSANQQAKDYRTKFKFNPIFRLFFCWVEPLFCLGSKRSLDFDDLYACPSEAESRHLFNKFNKYWSGELQRKKVGRSPRLFIAWLKCFWWRVILQGLLTLIEVACMVTLSELLGSLTDYFVINSPSPDETRKALLLVVGIVLASLGIMFFHAMGFHLGFLTGLNTKIMLTGMIYKKTLQLSQAMTGKLSVGHIVNLASNDIHKFDEAFVRYNFLWIGPLHVIVITYLLYIEIQWSAFLAAALLVLQVPLHSTVLKYFTKLRVKASRMADKRIKVMNEVISGIRVIKMYAWEYAFRDIVTSIRRTEIFIILKYFMCLSVSHAYKTASNTLIMFLIFSVYVSTTGNEIVPRKVFVSLSLITFVRLTSVRFFIIASHLAADARVAWVRIRDFLILDEQETANGDICSCIDGSIGHQSPKGVVVKDLCASWSMDNDKPTLQNISFTVNEEKPLLAVVGSVGSGKSTLLQCLLKELPALSGSVVVNGSVGYASQEAWVFSASVRDNILFGLPYDAERYNAVIEACALKKDIDLLPEGDMTLVGERGATLSGGQRARVNLARAVYRQADVYLLDDPLSAVDAAVSKHLFEKCICGLLSDRCVILVTHQVQYLSKCDAVLGLKEGRCVMFGDPTKCLNKTSDIINDERFNGESSRRGSNTRTRKNSIIKAIDVNDFMSDSVSDSTSQIPQDDLSSKEVVHKPAIKAEERAQGRLSMTTYIRYFIAGGGYIFTPIVVVIFLLAEANIVTADWWISDWADCDSENLNRSTCLLTDSQRIGVYGGLVGSLIIIGTLRTVFFFLLLLNAAKVVHNRMFAKVLRAPVLFFDTNPIGRILNRFSKDIGFLDDKLIYTSIDYLDVLVRFLAAMITASVANPYVVIAVVLMFIVSLVFRWYYLKTARDVKRLEALALSPIYSHLSLTIRGLSTIRSFSMEDEAMNQFHDIQNQHTQAAYLYIVVTRWFGMRIDIISTIFIATVGFASVALSSKLNASLVGLALTYAISLSGRFQYCVRQSAEVESLMISAERVMAYGKLESEAPLETDPSIAIKPNWPNKGQIQMNNVSYRHSKEGPLVLKGITCDIKPGEKVGVVGRTGAGKSSLIAALFRVAEPTGSIKIDGVETAQLGLHDVRNKMSIIPQDPVLFDGSVRYNLDPFNCYDDCHIWHVLEQVQLKTVVKGLEGGLESAVSEGGSNFSVGQRQLFCLARALLQNNCILILDEATANVDMETDAIIQQVIREQFSDCTVLTIAHRLDTVMDADKIMVLESGKLIEYDTPHLLLNQPLSYLSMLVNKSGSMNAERLRKMALDAYKNQSIKKQKQRRKKTMVVTKA